LPATVSGPVAVAFELDSGEQPKFPSGFQG
jgi:hypothetical protein